jgi:hypothetical protein
MRKIKETIPTSFDLIQSIEYIWGALRYYREDCISGNEYDEEWDDITTSMHWITEALDLELVEGNYCEKRD